MLDASESQEDFGGGGDTAGLTKLSADSLYTINAAAVKTN